MSVKPLLDVRDLSVSFIANGSTTPVVNNVSFVLNESETVAIVGESGSGKTVSALTILRMTIPWEVNLDLMNIHFNPI